jgi:hypothetical protein
MEIALLGLAFAFVGFVVCLFVVGPLFASEWSGYEVDHLN